MGRIALILIIPRLVAAGFVIAGAITAKESVTLLTGATEKTSGEVISVGTDTRTHRPRGRPARTTRYHYPTVRFEDTEGREHESRYTQDSSRTFEEGQELTICYDPDDPSRIRLPGLIGWWDLVKWPALFLIPGGLILFCPAPSPNRSRKTRSRTGQSETADEAPADIAGADDASEAVIHEPSAGRAAAREALRSSRTHSGRETRRRMLPNAPAAVARRYLSQTIRAAGGERFETGMKPFILFISILLLGWGLAGTGACLIGLADLAGWTIELPSQQTSQAVPRSGGAFGTAYTVIFYVILGGATGGFFLWFSLASIYKYVVSSDPVLLINEKGLWHHGGVFKRAQGYRWDQIDRIVSRELIDSENVRSRKLQVVLTSQARDEMGLDKNAGKDNSSHDLTILMGNIKAEPDDVLASIRRFAPLVPFVHETEDRR